MEEWALRSVVRAGGGQEARDCAQVKSVESGDVSLVRAVEAVEAGS